MSKLETLTETEHGWVIVNTDHPNAKGDKRVYASYFRRTRTESIKAFCEGAGQSWF